MVRGLRSLSFALDLVSALAYVFLVLGGRRLLPSQWLQWHLVNVFAGYSWPLAVRQYAGRRLERSMRPRLALLASSALTLVGLALFELGVQRDTTDFLVELPGVLLFSAVNYATMVGEGRCPAPAGGE